MEAHLSILKYLLILIPVITQGQTPKTKPCELYQKYTLGMSGLGVLDTHSFVEKGKMTTIQYIDFLIPINEITTVNADSGIYEIKHPDYPNCSEVMKKLRDTENSISDAKENNQVRVMLSLEIRDGKKTWKLGKYQW